MPQRIVSLTPNVTETLFAVGAGDQLAAVTDFCNYPAEPLADMPRIGAYLNPDIERMLSLSPDLVVVLPAQVGVRERMEAAGIATLTVRNESLDEILASIETLGEATGHGEEGRTLTVELRAEMDAVRAQVANRPPVSVLMVIGRGGDDLTGIFGVGPGTFLDEVIRTAGGSNVLAEAPTLYPQVPLEEVIRLAPQVIVEVVVPPSQLEPDQV
ncbi:MAG: ABC transporter substrate-binding protein, partial [Myxococcota bacterium]|nr:ABC transporter substrate-binding protein [Myxococcota bacterium]